MWRSTEESKSYIFTWKCGKTHKSTIMFCFHTKKWQNTQKSSWKLILQRRNTMAWRVQPRRFWARLADTRCQNVALEPCYCCDCCRHVIAAVLVVPNPSQGALPLAGRGRRIKRPNCAVKSPRFVPLIAFLFKLSLFGISLLNKTFWSQKDTKKPLFCFSKVAC